MVLPALSRRQGRELISVTAGLTLTSGLAPPPVSNADLPPLSAGGWRTGTGTELNNSSFTSFFSLPSRVEMVALDFHFPRVLTVSETKWRPYKMAAGLFRVHSLTWSVWTSLMLSFWLASCALPGNHFRP